MNKVQILVIEDDIAIGNLITTTLEMENYQFRLAKTAKQGIMNVLSYNPDIMLLDLGLPDMHTTAWKRWKWLRNCNRMWS